MTSNEKETQTLEEFEDDKYETPKMENGTLGQGKGDAKTENSTSEGENNDRSGSRKTATKIAKVAVGATVGVTAIAASPFLLGAIGFTAGGVAAGSFAASMMSALGTTGATGAVVATMQSMGTGALCASQFVAGGALGGAIGGLIPGFAKKKTKLEKVDKNVSTNDDGDKSAACQESRGSPDGSSEQRRVVDRSADCDLKAQPNEEENEGDTSGKTISENKL